MSDAFDAIRARHERFDRRTAWLWTELELVRDRWRATEHPLLEGLARGTLDRAALADFAGEHDHVLAALAAAAEDAALASDGLLGDALRAHAGVRARQLAAWRTFARDAAWGGRASWHYGEDPYDSTLHCVRLLCGDADTELAQRLVTLHAFARLEAELGAFLGPPLALHYELSGPPGTAFARATSIAHAQAGVLAAALEGLGPYADPFALLDHAEAVVRAYWRLLDDLLP